MARPSPLPAFLRCPRLDLALILIASVFPAVAQPPVVEHLFPAGGQRGTVLNFSLGGSLGSTPLRPWSDSAGLHFEADESPGQFRLALAPTVSPGPHLVRFFNAQGCTAPRLFIVGELPETIELGSPEFSGIGEELRTLPVTVNGRLSQPGEVDTYRLRLEPSQTFRAELTALGFDSPLAARLTLLAPDGAAVGESTNAPVQDPVLVTTIHQRGVHRLLVESAARTAATARVEAAGEARIYRLACTLVPPLPAPSVTPEPPASRSRACPTQDPPSWSGRPRTPPRHFTPRCCHPRRRSRARSPASSIRPATKTGLAFWRHARRSIASRPAPAASRLLSRPSCVSSTGRGHPRRLSARPGPHARVDRSR
ncbi:MAG: hypothetical protein M5U12_02020 [Verrucomicrobia bacterium]|nr:hypothetical protein [Verrucomicrobiota bacterium]